MRDDLIDDDTFGKFVYELSSNVVIWGGPFSELLSFRCLGRHELCDQAVLRYISILDRKPREIQFSEDCVAVWRNLSALDQTSIVSEFFFHLDRVLSSERQHCARWSLQIAIRVICISRRWNLALVSLVTHGSIDDAVSSSETCLPGKKASHTRSHSVKLRHFNSLFRHYRRH